MAYTEKNTATEAQKKAGAFLSRCRPGFEKSVQLDPDIAVTGGIPAVGTEMPDGTIYAGISPDTNQLMYAAPADAPISMDFNAAAKYAKGLQVGDKKDFRVPSKAELDVLFRNREEGALKGAFNLTGAFPASYYWSSTTIVDGGDNCGCYQRFSDGVRHDHYLDRGMSVRCIRSV